MQLEAIGEPPVGGMLYYRSDEYSIDFAREDQNPTEAGVASLLLNMLQIDVDVASGHVLGPWGLLPHTRWIHSSLPALTGVERRSLEVRGERLTSGVAIGVGDEWETHFDDSSHVLEMRIAAEPVDAWFEFAEGCILGLTGGRPVRLRLHPRFDPE